MTTTRPKRGNGFKDMTGEVFGNLTVVEYAGSYVGGGALWLCRCECGQETEERGTSLRKGDRKSCGCLDPQSGRRRRTKKPTARGARSTKGRCWVADRDGMLALVGSSLDEALVEFDAVQRAWVCSEHGAEICEHVAATTRSLPLDVALRVASIVAPRRSGPLSTKTGGAKDGEDDNQRALADALARSASERAERASRYDSQHRQATGTVTTRQMTDADHERLRERRARKRIGD